MFSRVRPIKFALLAAVVASAVFGTAKSACADTLNVEYYTVGDFSAAGASFGPLAPASYSAVDNFGGLPSGPAYTGSSNIVITDSVGPGVTTITYNYSGDVGTGLLLTGSHYAGSGPLGTFSVSSTDPLITISGLAFTLDIYQLQPPAVGASTLAGSISGFLFTGGGANLSVSFNPPSTTTNTLPPVTYSPDQPTSITNLGSAVSLQAEITAPAPLPTIASMGLTMMGLMTCGLAGKIIHRRSASV